MTTDTRTARRVLRPRSLPVSALTAKPRMTLSSKASRGHCNNLVRVAARTRSRQCMDILLLRVHRWCKQRKTWHPHDLHPRTAAVATLVPESRVRAHVLFPMNPRSLSPSRGHRLTTPIAQMRRHHYCRRRRRQPRRRARTLSMGTTSMRVATHTDTVMVQ